MDTVDYWAASLELKTVSTPQRLIVGHAAIHHNIDRVRDIIDPGASAKAMARITHPGKDVTALIAHRADDLPIGIPQKIEATPQGLYTETYILKGPAGDNLLAVAQDLLDHGLALGMSIGYKTHDSRMEQTARGRVRRILDYELKEFSYASAQAIANPSALVSAVKTRRRAAKALTEGADSAGGALVTPGRPPTKGDGSKMLYRVQKNLEAGTWTVLCDTDADGDDDDGQVVGTYASEEMATAVAVALHQRFGANPGRGDDGDDEDERADSRAALQADKTASGGGAMDETKAVWTAKYVDSLPNSSFLWVEDGEDDADGKRVPRSKRHLPYKDAAGTVDKAHLRNALARIPQTDGLDDGKKAQLQARARRMLESADDGKTYVEPDEWKSGAPLLLTGLAYDLLDLAGKLAGEQKAMALLGEDTKDRYRMRPGVRAEVRAVLAAAAKLVDHADRIDSGEDAAARAALYRHQLDLVTL